MFPKDIFIRNIRVEETLEVFFVSAISTILAVRAFLFITGYPSIGGGTLHIAHMLWGGFFMLASIIMLLSFLNRSGIWLAAGFGGIGFGLFIDELGKFITRDNNYFFQPTVALIYVIFVILYLIFRAIPKYRAYSEKEYLTNSIDLMKEAVVNDLDIEEEKLAYAYLKRCDPKNPIVTALLDLLTIIEAVEPQNPSILTNIRRSIRKKLAPIVRSSFLAHFVIFVLILQSFSVIAFILYISYSGIFVSFDQWGVLITSFVSAVFVIWGMVLFRKSKWDAYKQFKNAVLVSIFLTQFFVFYSAQFYALISLFFNISILIIIDYVLKIEQTKMSQTSESRYAI